MKRAMLPFALLLLVPTTLFAQQADCRHRTIPVSVVDEKEVPLTGLTAENFRGEFRGGAVRIVSAKLDTSPRRIVILLDLSGSMSTENKNRVAEILVWHVLRSSPNGSELALITFADKVKVQAGLLRDRQSILNLAREVNFLDPKAFKGRTMLWDAVGEAVNLLNPPQPGDVVYAVTDGGDSASRKRESDVEKALLWSGLRFFASNVWPDLGFRNRTLEELYGPTELKDLAEMTGGRVLDLRTEGVFGVSRRFDLSLEGQKKILEPAGLILTQMQQFYLVEMELMKEVDKPRSWKLELVSAGGQFKDFSLHYPRKLLPCPAAKDTPQTAPK